MKEFILNNLHYFVFLGIIAFILICAMLVFLCIRFHKISNSLTVKKFKIYDLNEQDEIDYTLYYTVVVSNMSVNTVTINSIGFVHDGNYFNFTDTLRKQLNNNTHAPTIEPRSIIKLKLTSEIMEKVIFPTLSTKKLKKIKVYVITTSGEKFEANSKIISSKLGEDFKTYYAFHRFEINSNFIAIVKEKLAKNVKLGFFEKRRYNSLRKEIPNLDKLSELEKQKKEQEEQKRQNEQTKTDTTPDIDEDLALAVDTKVDMNTDIDTKEDNCVEKDLNADTQTVISDEYTNN